MMQFAAGATALKELIGILTDVIEDPNTYAKIDGLRQIISKVVGKEVDKNGLIALLEETTQGEAYTGKWEPIGGDGARRLRVAQGYIYHVAAGTNPILVRDK